MSLTLRKGNPTRVNYTPTGGNVSSGDIVVLGNTAGITCGIATKDIANNELGTLEIGGGIYEGLTADANIAAWTEVFVDAANFAVSASSNTGQKFGYTTEAIVANTTGKVLHDPVVPA